MTVQGDDHEAPRRPARPARRCRPWPTIPMGGMTPATWWQGLASGHRPSGHRARSPGLPSGRGRAGGDACRPGPALGAILAFVLGGFGGSLLHLAGIGLGPVEAIVALSLLAAGAGAAVAPRAGRADAGLLRPRRPVPWPCLRRGDHRRRAGSAGRLSRGAGADPGGASGLAPWCWRATTGRVCRGWHRSPVPGRRWSAGCSSRWPRWRDDGCDDGARVAAAAASAALLRRMRQRCRPSHDPPAPGVLACGRRRPRAGQGCRRWPGRVCWAAGAATAGCVVGPVTAARGNARGHRALRRLIRPDGPTSAIRRSRPA